MDDDTKCPMDQGCHQREELRQLPPMTKGEWALMKRVFKKEGLAIPDWSEMKVEKEGD